jgi:hypothetical protein
LDWSKPLPTASRRFSFYLTGHSVPLAHALAEDYLLDEVAAGETRFTYNVAIKPRLALSIGGPIARTYFGSMVRNACKGLQNYVPEAGTSPPAAERRHEGGRVEPNPPGIAQRASEHAAPW